MSAANGNAKRPSNRSSFILSASGARCAASASLQGVGSPPLGMPDAPDGFVIHSFSADDPITCRDYVREKCGLPAFQPNGQRRRRSSEEVEKLLAVAIDVQERKPKGTLSAKYRYVDHDGTLLYQVLRYDNPKRFVQRRPDGKDWIWNLQGQPRVLYALPGILKYPFATVFVTEGERDADNLIILELCATTVASGKWEGVDLEPLRDRDCIVLEDNDEPGVKKALDAAKRLHGVAATVRIVLLPDLPEHGDVSDWLNVNRNDKDRLIDLCFATPIWIPEDAGGIETPAEENNALVTVPAAPESVLANAPAGDRKAAQYSYELTNLGPIVLAAAEHVGAVVQHD